MGDELRDLMARLLEQYEIYHNDMMMMTMMDGTRYGCLG